MAERDTGIEYFVSADFRSVTKRLDGFDVIAVDMPIGLPASGARDCDRLARRRLGAKRGASVFPAPLRAVLGSADYDDACGRREKIDGMRMSRQAYNILPKVADVDRVLRRIGQDRVYEVHPELAFAELAGRPMADNKRQPAGREARLRLLGRAFRAADLEAALQAFPRRQAAQDDVIDAFACLWSARRIRAGTAIRLPSAPQYDAVGLEMAIRA